VDYSPKNGHPLLDANRIRRTRSLGLLQLLSPNRSTSTFHLNAAQTMVEALPPIALNDDQPSLASKLRGAFSRGLRQSESFHGKPSMFGSPSKHTMGKTNEAEVGLRYLRELIRTERIDMIPACSSSIFESISSRICYETPDLKAALLAFLQWSDNFCIYENGKEVIKRKEEAVGIIDAIERALRGIPSRPSTARSGSNRGLSPPVLRPKGRPPPLSERGLSLQNNRREVQDQSIDDLMRQLNLRQVAKFEPVFADVDADSDDDVEGVTVRERKEERAEKHGEKTCEEEVEKLPDGSEIRRTKTRTVNMQQSSKHVTISSRGGGLPEKTQRFVDGSNDYDEDEDFQKTASRDFFNRFNQMKSDRFGGDRPSLTFESNEPLQTTKKKTVEKTSEVLQSVEENKKKNGKMIIDNAAHQKDTTELKATQIETYKGDKLLDRTGDGSYEEATIVGAGRPNSLEEGTPRKHVVEYVQTFGTKNNTAEDFFRGCTLNSYIVLNDNLRIHEEQFRKKISFEFSSTSGAGATPEFSKLNDLLQATDFVNLKMPTKYAIMEDLETCEADAMQPKNVAYPEKPQLTGDIAVLQSFDASEYLVRHPSDSNHRPDEVRGGPKDALLVFCTQSSSLLYQEAFIAAYRSFMPSDEVIQKLITRYLYMETRNEGDSIKHSHMTFSLLVRITDELCANEIDDKLIRSITAFVYHLIRQDNINLARILRKRLLDRIDRLNICKQAPGPLPVLAQITPRKKYSFFRSRADTIYDFKSSVLAQQITMLDAQLFERIEPPELLWWAEEQNEKKSPNLARFTEHFNKISYWVRTLIITRKDQKERERMANKLIKIMKQLRRIGNLHSYLAILSALESGPIRRLDWSKGVVEQLSQHSEIMDSTFSFKKYRTLLTETAPPCIPYFGLVLQDLTFVHVGNQQYLTKDQVGERENLINYNKIWQQYAVLDSMRKFRLWSYTFDKEERILRFLNNFDKHLNEEETWQLSEQIKPRNWGKTA
ncbi:hypothetical protein PENTCL1PPCAC_28366, partial [Pristionchus entomophagus]